MSKDPQCKGTVILFARAFVVERWGKGAWEEIATSMAPGEAAMLGGVVSIGWYPEPAFVRILHSLEALRPAAARELATFEAERDLAVIHRMFLHLANPAYVLEKAGSYWRRFHDTGEWLVHRTTTSSASGELRAWGVVDPLACTYLGAYIHRMFELVGAHGVSVEHKRCRAEGAETCVFGGAWRS
jgi:hypothetical protein